MRGRVIPYILIAQFLVAFTVAVSLGAQVSRLSAGDILELRGNWRIAGRSLHLMPGEGVMAGSTIESDQGDKNDFITIVLVNGQRLFASCSASPCSSTIRVPAAYIDEDVSFKSILDAVGLVLLNRRPEVSKAYAATSSRSIFGPKRREMVVPFANASEVPLGPALAGMQEGRYHLDLTKISDGKFVASKEVKWDGSHELAVALPEAGFYLATFGDEAGALALDVFVAAIPEKSEPAIRSKFEEAQRICAKWEGPEAEDSAHLFLRSYLLSITEER